MALEATPSGQPLLDREKFWARLKQVVDAKEVFKFASNKKDPATGAPIVKEVYFARSVLDEEHRASIHAIFDRWEATKGGHPKHLALLLGTAYRETCGRMLSSVGEACGCARTCNKDEFLDAEYGKKDGCGRAYFGRGFVQITKRKNYLNVGEKLALPLADYPDLAYELPIATALLIDGVKGRWYAGKPLTQYLNDKTSDWVQARDSVNPGSPNKAATGYLACRFYDAVRAAYKQPAPSQPASLCMELKNL